MALITTYATLQAAIADYLNRDDLTDQIKIFIQLAEADIARVLDLPTEVVSHTLTAGSDIVNLAAATYAAQNPFGLVKEVRLNTDTYMHPITMTSSAALNGLRRFGSGVPYYGSIRDAVLNLDIVAESAYAIKILYVPGLVPLSDANDDNDTLLTHPDIYLFGALKEAEPYLEHDERNPMWSQKYLKAVKDANIALERANFGAPMIARLPINFG
jgi:hypothetical protein